jgi:hypothetical protein
MVIVPFNSMDLSEDDTSVPGVSMLPPQSEVATYLAFSTIAFPLADNRVKKCRSAINRIVPVEPIDFLQG